MDVLQGLYLDLNLWYEYKSCPLYSYSKNKKNEDFYEITDFHEMLKINADIIKETVGKQITSWQVTGVVEFIAKYTIGWLQLFK